MRTSVASDAAPPSFGRCWRSSVIGVPFFQASSSRRPSIEMGAARWEALADGTGADWWAALVRCAWAIGARIMQAARAVVSGHTEAARYIRCIGGVGGRANGGSFLGWGSRVE